MKCQQLCDKSRSLIGRLSWFPPLLGRISVGAVFAESGWGKIHDIPKVTEFFTELQIPAPHFQAILVANTELLCGTAVLVGLLTRLASIPLIATMSVAILTAKMSEIKEVTDLLGMSEFMYIVVLVWLVVSGPGRVSLDALFCKRSAK